MFATERYYLVLTLYFDDLRSRARNIGATILQYDTLFPLSMIPVVVESRLKEKQTKSI